MYFFFALRTLNFNSASPQTPQNISQFSLKCIFLYEIEFIYLKTMKLDTKYPLYILRHTCKDRATEYMIYHYLNGMHDIKLKVRDHP